MAVFDDLKLNWAGDDYSIPANNMLRVIASIESVITLNELIDKSQNGTIPLSRIAQAYGTVLRHAGCDVTDEEVYAGLFDKESEGEVAMTAVMTLMQMMVPPDHLTAEGSTSTPGKSGASKGPRQKATSKKRGQR